MKYYILASVLVASFAVHARTVQADGKLVPPRDYDGSLEEHAQEAIIISKGGTETKSATQQMILKIRIQGDVDHFA